MSLSKEGSLFFVSEQVSITEHIINTYIMVASSYNVCLLVGGLCKTWSLGFINGSTSSFSASDDCVVWNEILSVWQPPAVNPLGCSHNSNCAILESKIKQKVKVIILPYCHSSVHPYR